MATEYVTSEDGVKIAYTKQGSGPAVVLVDGAMCYRAAGVTPILQPELAKHFTVYAYDRRGRDESGDHKPYSVNCEIADLKAMMDVAGGNPYVCGFSSGAGLALYAAAAGLKPKKLMLYEAPFTLVDSTDRALPEDCVPALDKMIAQGKRGAAVDYFMGTLIGVPGFFTIMMRVFMRKSWNNCIKVAHTIPYDIRIMDQTRFQPPAQVAAQVNVPTVVGYGEKTSAGIKKGAKALAGMIPGAELKELPKASHYIKPEVLVPALVEYFK